MMASYNRYFLPQFYSLISSEKVQMAKRVKGMGGGNERVNDSTALRVFTVHTHTHRYFKIVASFN